MTEDEMAGWHHRLDGHEFEQAPEDGEGQGRPPPTKPLCSAGGMAAGCPLPEPTLVAPVLAFLWSPSPSSPGLTLPLLWSLL